MTEKKKEKLEIDTSKVEKNIKKITTDLGGEFAQVNYSEKETLKIISKTNDTITNLDAHICDLTRVLEEVILSFQGMLDSISNKTSINDLLTITDESSLVTDAILGVGTGIVGSLAVMGVEEAVVGAASSLGLSTGAVGALVAGLVLLLGIAIHNIICDWDNISGLFSGIWKTISGIFSGDYQSAESGFNETWKRFLSSEHMPYNMASGIAMLLGNDIEGIYDNILKYLENGGSMINYFGLDKVADLLEGPYPWTGLVNQFSEEMLGLGETVISNLYLGINEGLNDVKRIWNLDDGMGDVMKGMINSVIRFLNWMILSIEKGINNLISELNRMSFDIPDWVPGLGGKTLGFDLKLLSAPQIPYLAKGAVLPANRPFLAVVGDQRHGTNVEAPLATIQEAVALVLEDHIGAMMAGFEALLKEQQATRRTIEGIEIGDTVIGRAAERYGRKIKDSLKLRSGGAVRRLQSVLGHRKKGEDKVVLAKQDRRGYNEVKERDGYVLSKLR